MRDSRNLWQYPGNSYLIPAEVERAHVEAAVGVGVGWRGTSRNPLSVADRENAGQRQQDVTPHLFRTDRVYWCFPKKSRSDRQ